MRILLCITYILIYVIFYYYYHRYRTEFTSKKRYEILLFLLVSSMSFTLVEIEKLETTGVHATTINHERNVYSNIIMLLLERDTRNLHNSSRTNYF